LNTGLVFPVLSRTRITVPVPLACFRSKYAPEYLIAGLVPKRKLPLTNSFSLELVEPTLTVSLEVSTNSVPLSTFNADSVDPMLVQA